jgi:AraC family transcriptional regulator of adaptative response/methylated-DNA-[protein]-cysteine methyltransferase
MSKKLDFSKMYQALINKDSSYEGIFIVSVKTTGIFCRPTCRARKPKQVNVEFFSTIQEALRRGYRPCKICSPMSSANESPPWLKKLLKDVNKESGYRMSDQDIRDQGIDPNRLRRWFKKHHNMTFQAYLRSLRVGNAFGHLTNGGKVIDTAFTNGYESLSGFSAAFKKLTGESPTSSKKGEIIKTYQVLTPLGPMLAGSVKSGICLLEFTDRRMLEKELIDLQKRFKASIVTSYSTHIKLLKKQLDEYFMGERTQFNVSLCTPGSEFQNNVWKALRGIPYGETRSYKDQAKAIGNPKAVRAVARANGDNKIAIIIPCHRVIGSDGNLTGYGGGVERKKRLLEIEGVFHPTDPVRSSVRY